MLTYAICIVCMKKLSYASRDETRLVARVALCELRARREAPESTERGVPAREQRLGARRAGEPHVELEQLEQSLGVTPLQRHECDEVAVHEALVRVEQECLPARHPRTEIAAVVAEHDDR